MKIKSIIILIIIVLIIVLSCNIQYLGPDNALEEASKINFFVYQIHLPASSAGGAFQCPVIYDAIDRSGGSRLGIRGIINRATILSIADCLRKIPSKKVFLYADALLPAYRACADCHADRSPCGSGRAPDVALPVGQPLDAFGLLLVSGRRVACRSQGLSV